MKRHCYVPLIVSLLMLIAQLGCSFPFATNTTIISQFDVKLTDIGFTQNTDIFSQDTLRIAGDQLRFKVDVTPKNSFTGEPFRTVTLGNEDIGYETIVQSTPALWIVLLSNDGYYFCNEGPLTWTPEELELPDASERDYYKIQQMEERRVKHTNLFAPSSDKASVALLEDSNKLAEELLFKQWQYLITGDWLFEEDYPEEFDEENIQAEFEDLFYEHFKLMLVDKEGLQKLRGDDIE